MAAVAGTTAEGVGERAAGRVIDGVAGLRVRGQALDGRLEQRDRVAELLGCGIRRETCVGLRRLTRISTRLDVHVEGRRARCEHEERYEKREIGPEGPAPPAGTPPHS